MPITARQCACTAHTSPTRNGHDARPARPTPDMYYLGRRRRGGEAAGKPAGPWRRSKGAIKMVRRARTTTSHLSIDRSGQRGRRRIVCPRVTAAASLWLPTLATAYGSSRLRRPVAGRQPPTSVDLVIRDRTRRVMETTTWCTYAMACRKQQSTQLGSSN